MAKGTKIIVSSEPHGTFEEGIINDTSSPGYLVERVTSKAFQGNVGWFQARQTQSAGGVGPVCVLLEDQLQGKVGVKYVFGAGTSSGGVTVAGLPQVGDAYVANTRCRVYWPIAGEQLNLVLGDVAGTGDTVSQGALFGANNNGKIIADSSYNDAPFQAMETLTALTADTPLWVQYLGRCVG
jgi:hypothetical protein